MTYKEALERINKEYDLIRYKERPDYNYNQEYYDDGFADGLEVALNILKDIDTD